MGEEPRSIGFEAEDIGINFIRSLGYEILDAPNEEFDLDCVAEFRPIIGHRGLQRPRYSLTGLTAFEIKSQVASRSRIAKFERKILQHNQSTSDRKIMGGVFFIDRRISNAMHKCMESKGIYGWDSRRLSFYENKLRIFNEWMDHGMTTEIVADDRISYLRCFSPFNEKRILIRLSVFFDDHCHVLSVSRAKDIMEKIRQQSLSPLADAGLVPIETLFEFHALGGGKNPSLDLSFLKLDWRRVGINVVFGSFINYRTFPQLARVQFLSPKTPK